MGSNPTASADSLAVKTLDVLVAQRIERWFAVPKAGGSSPPEDARYVCSTYLDFLLRTYWTDGLIFLSVRWMQPIQQQGRRIPSFSSEITRLTCSFLVFNCLTDTVQQIHSFLAKGVKLCQSSFAVWSELSAFCKSGGSLWTVPPAILILVMTIFYSNFSPYMFNTNIKRTLFQRPFDCRESGIYSFCIWLLRRKSKSLVSFLHWELSSVSFIQHLRKWRTNGKAVKNPTK